MELENIIHCCECMHCFESKRSKTGYCCVMWGYDDIADDTVLEGFCHKAKRDPRAHLRNWEDSNNGT